MTFNEYNMFTALRYFIFGESSKCICTTFLLMCAKHAYINSITTNPLVLLHYFQVVMLSFYWVFNTFSIQKHCGLSFLCYLQCVYYVL
jgi:F0F1-type ATP synthase assembly protein I